MKTAMTKVMAVIGKTVAKIGTKGNIMNAQICPMMPKLAQQPPARYLGGFRT
jgi:hypothetical protein